MLLGEEAAPCVIALASRILRPLEWCGASQFGRRVGIEAVSPAFEV
jgi:hypothetical protein